MWLRLLSGLLILITLFGASWLASGLTASTGGLPLAASWGQPAPAADRASTWTVENRCRTLYLPVLLNGGGRAAAALPLALGQPAQGPTLNCIRVSAADLAQLEWDAVAETQARQANRNRQAFDMAPLSTGGR